jgi:hypothetical protein
LSVDVQLQLIWVGIFLCSWILSWFAIAAELSGDLQLQLNSVGICNCSWTKWGFAIAAELSGDLQLQLNSVGILNGPADNNLKDWVRAIEERCASKIVFQTYTDIKLLLVLVRGIASSNLSQHFRYTLCIVNFCISTRVGHLMLQLQVWILLEADFLYCLCSRIIYKLLTLLSMFC